MNSMATAAPPSRTALPFPLRSGPVVRYALSRIQKAMLASVFVLFAAVGVGAAAVFVWPSSVYEDRFVSAGHSAQFPPGTVTSFPAASRPVGDGYDTSPGFHIVRLEDGELLALLDRDGWFGLPLEYYPDSVFNGEVTGWFRGVRSPSTYDMAGYLFFGPGPGALHRLAVEVRDGVVYVDPRAITPAPPRPDGYKLQTGGSLQPWPAPFH